MPDWSASMQQTFEYYTVDPGTWKDVKLLTNVKSCSITRDYETDTLGSATFDVTDSVGEAYIRVYLVTIQNGITEKHPLGTYLIQTPSSSFNGKVRNVSMDAYTPLLELKENPPPLGYYIAKKENIMDNAYRIVRDHVRAPVIQSPCSAKLYTDFVAESEDNWLTFVKDLIAGAKLDTVAKDGQSIRSKYSGYTLGLDELGRVLFLPKQDTASLQPVYTFNDDNSSILYADFTMQHDLYGVPNVVEVLYSNGGEFYYARVVNDDPNSPISTVNRGREIIHRVQNPDLIGDPTNDQIQEYAHQLLRDLSTLEYEISFTHGYYPLRLGDCIRLNYSRAGVTDIKAKIISQSIKCEPGCPVSTKAVFTTKLWG